MKLLNNAQSGPVLMQLLSLGDQATRMRWRICWTLLCITLASCSSPPPVKQVTREEQIQQDNTRGKELVPQFESQLKIKKDIEVTVYLRNIATRLTHQVPDLNNSPIGVLLYADKEKKWRNYAVPGNRVYLSTAFVKSLEFENELAAAIAFELSNISKRWMMDRVEKLTQQEPVTGQNRLDFFGPAGVFNFSDEELLSSIDGAIDILYLAGFDTRGLVSLFQKYQSSPNQSPYESSSLLKMIDRTRQAIAMHAPLRNPVVRSEAFLKMQKRLQNL